MSQPWQPQESGVLQLCHLLSEYQKPGTNQAQIIQQLDHCRHFPDFNNYLAFIFAHGDNVPIEVRQSAGLLLKNNLKTKYASTTEDLRTYIKAVLLTMLGHAERPLRQTAGTVISVIVSQGGLQSWPDLLMALVTCLQSDQPATLEGALDTLYKIAEDAGPEMDVEIVQAGQRASQILVPPLLKLFTNPVPDVRRMTVAVLNMLTRDMTLGMIEHLGSYVQGLFGLAEDSVPGVRKEVCGGMVQLLSLRVDMLLNHMPQIVEYMLVCNQDADAGVALESCEFWTVFCDVCDVNEDGLDPKLLVPFLPRIVPVLTKNMIFDPTDSEVIDAEAAEEKDEKDDSERDIKPFMHHSRTHGVRAEDEEEDELGDTPSNWNLRKCSAAGLDYLSNMYGDDLLAVLLPIVEQRLTDPDWRVRESAILALGAVSEGCHNGLRPHLPSILSMLLPQLEDPRPMVRIISCWTLSRYSHWLIDQCAQGGPQMEAGLSAVVNGLLKRVLDHNKHVQEAGCSALAQFEENAGMSGQAQVLVPHLKVILEHLKLAAQGYKRRNLRFLYDALRQLADVVGPALSDATLSQLVMPVLFQKAQGLDDLDKELLPLLDCISAFAVAMGHAFEAFAKPLYDKCIRILGMQLEIRHAFSVGQPHSLEYDKDYVVCSLNMISGLAEGLGPSLEPLVASSPLVEALLQSCGDPHASVRQSAFALVGDLARTCIGHCLPHLREFIDLALRNLAPEVLEEGVIPAANNSAWAIGELIIKVRPESLLEPYIMVIAEKLAIVLQMKRPGLRSVLENCAITMGRLGWLMPEPVAPHLGHFIAPWCNALRGVHDDIMKEQAFLGLCRLVRLNPEAAVSAWIPFAGALASWRHLGCEGLQNEMSQLLHNFKNGVTADRWKQMMDSLEEQLRMKLISTYHL